MHHLDLGLFRYQIEYTYELLKLQHGNVLVEEVDHCLSAIPRYPGLKIFANGLQSIARLTVNEYQSLMKVMLFVIDNLYVGPIKRSYTFFIQVLYDIVWNLYRICSDL